MEIDQIETFLAVATFGGFHRAAEALRISEPAVSARIKALEQSLGSTLFARSRVGLHSLMLAEPFVRMPSNSYGPLHWRARLSMNYSRGAKAHCRLRPRFPSVCTFSRMS